MKVGKIKISDSFILNGKIFDILPIMSKFVPIHIENRPHYRDYIYTGYCDSFDDIKEGNEIPFYNCLIDSDGQVKFEK